jgi:AcrR family transcriptional regulator
MQADDAAPTSRGDSTREALVRAAIEAFGHDGFAAASTRAIAQAAGVNQALIGYHFGGKPGLYRAALEHIAAAVERRMGPVVAGIREELGVELPPFGAPSAGPRTPAAAIDPSGLIAALKQLLDGFVVLLTSAESAPWARLVLREQQDPSESFDILYGRIMRPLFEVAATLLANIRGGTPADPANRLLIVTLLGQVLVFRAARATVTRQMNWPVIGDAEAAAIRERIRQNVDAILNSESMR